jgi:hypothetical protein
MPLAAHRDLLLRSQWLNFCIRMPTHHKQHMSLLLSVASLTAVRDPAHACPLFTSIPQLHAFDLFDWAFLGYGY